MSHFVQDEFQSTNSEGNFKHIQYMPRNAHKTYPKHILKNTSKTYSKHKEQTKTYIQSIYNFQFLPVVPHKAAAEVSKIGSLQERLVAVNHEWQSKSTDGPKGGWSCVF